MLLLYKRKNMISGRQALQRLQSLIQESPGNDTFLYLRLKLLYMIGDFQTFEDHLRNFDPKTFEFKFKKYKIACKFALSNHNVALAQSELANLDNLLNEMKQWKEVNSIPDECLPIAEKHSSVLRFLYAKILVLQKEEHNAIRYIDRVTHKSACELASFRITVERKLHGYKRAVSISEKFINDESTQDESNLSEIWRELALAFAVEGLVEQANAASKQAGVFRFPRIDVVFPYLKIALFVNDSTALDAYFSKLDVKYFQSKRNEYSNLLVQFMVFRCAIAMHSLDRLINISKNAQNVSARKQYERISEITSLSAEIQELLTTITSQLMELSEYKTKSKETISLKLISLAVEEMLYTFTDLSIIFLKIKGISTNSALSALAKQSYENILKYFPTSQHSISFLLRQITYNTGKKSLMEQLLSISKLKSAAQLDLLHEQAADAIVNNDSSMIDTLKQRHSGKPLFFLHIFITLLFDIEPDWDFSFYQLISQFKKKTISHSEIEKEALKLFNIIHSTTLLKYIQTNRALRIHHWNALQSCASHFKLDAFQV